MSGHENGIWFDTLLTSKNTNRNIVLHPSDLEEFAKLVRTSVKNNKFNPENLTIKDFAPRIVFISVSEFPVMATVFQGEGYGLFSAFEDAFKKLQQRFRKLTQHHIVKIDIVTSVKILENCDKKTKYNLIYGLEGIAFGREFDLAILPEQLSSNYLLENRSELIFDNLYDYLENDPLKAQNLFKLLRNQEFSSYIFKTNSFLLENDKFLPLYRGQVLFYEFSYKDLQTSIELGAKYLVNSILPNGRYDYRYSVNKNVSVRDYNFLRHAGTCFSLAEYFEVSKDQACLVQLKKAINYMKLFAFPGLENPETICFVDRGLSKIGGNGLTALALAKYISVTGEESNKDFLTKVCNWLVIQTKDDGNFRGHQQYYHNGRYYDSEVLYYPGEVIYGLTKSYKLIKTEAWLITAQRIANWIINTRDKDVDDLNLPHDHWLLYGLNELYRIDPNPMYLEHAAKTCKAIIEYQIQSSKYLDYIGAHNNKSDPSSTQAAVRSEGLIAAYKLFRDYNYDSDLSNRILKYLKGSIAFELRTQYNFVNTIYLKDAKKALGGFRESLDVHSIRIDYVQHNISALIGLLEIFDDLLNSA